MKRLIITPNESTKVIRIGSRTVQVKHNGFVNVLNLKYNKLCLQKGNQIVDVTELLQK